MAVTAAGREKVDDTGEDEEDDESEGEDEEVEVGEACGRPIVASSMPAVPGGLVEMISSGWVFLTAAGAAAVADVRVVREAGEGMGVIEFVEEDGDSSTETLEGMACGCCYTSGLLLSKVKTKGC